MSWLAFTVALSLDRRQAHIVHRVDACVHLLAWPMNRRVQILSFVSMSKEASLRPKAIRKDLTIEGHNAFAKINSVTNRYRPFAGGASSARTGRYQFAFFWRGFGSRKPLRLFPNSPADSGSLGFADEWLRARS